MFLSQPASQPKYRRRFQQLILTFLKRFPFPVMKGAFVQMLRSCSAVYSFRQLMDTRLPEKRIKCLYGVKFFAIIWLIMGNTGQLRAGNMTTNMKEMEKTLHSMTTQFVLNKDLAIDTLLLVR